jgi:hypothetical protein
MVGWWDGEIAAMRLLLSAVAEKKLKTPLNVISYTFCPSLA